MRILHRTPGWHCCGNRPFDVIVGDVFHDVAIPFHLVTRRIRRLVRQRLTPDGLYLMNVVDAFPDPRLIKAIVKTLHRVPHVDIWMDHVPERARHLHRHRQQRPAAARRP
jgi:spermidine synthase